jgi:hypothetical protein
VIVKDAAYFRTQGARCRRFARQVKYTHPDMARALIVLAEEFDRQGVRAPDSEKQQESDQQKTGKA